MLRIQGTFLLTTCFVVTEEQVNKKLHCQLKCVEFSLSKTKRRLSGIDMFRVMLTLNTERSSQTRYWVSMLSLASYM